MRRVTVAEVRASYPDEKSVAEFAGELPVWLWARPLSFLLTPPVVALGVPATAVTVVGGLVALALPVAAMFGSWPGVVALAMGFQVLDCVDGNVARVTRTETRAGALLDGAVDRVFWTLLLLAVGLLAGVAWGVPAALAAATMRLFDRDLRWQAGLLGGRAAPAGWGFALVAGLEHAWPIALAAGALLGAIPVVLGAIVAHVAVVLAVSAALSLRAVR